MKTTALIFAVGIALTACNSKSTETITPATDTVITPDTSAVTITVTDSVVTAIIDSVKPESKQLEALTAADVVSSFCNEAFGRKTYSFSCKESSLKKKGFTRKGNKWARTNGDNTITIAESGEDMDKKIKITFSTPDECKAFIATLKNSGLEPSQYGGAGTYSSGIGDMDISASTTSTTVTFSY